MVASASISGFCWTKLGDKYVVMGCLCGYEQIFLQTSRKGLRRGGIFWGVGRGCFEKKVVTLRGATDFREDKNPPQTNNIVSIVSIERVSCVPYIEVGGMCGWDRWAWKK
jgi:hypothetical protein